MKEDVKFTIQTKDKVVGMKKSARLDLMVEGETEMVKAIESGVRKVVIEKMAGEDGEVDDV